MANSVSTLQNLDNSVYQALAAEKLRQQSGIELIPSENYTYPEVLELLGSVFTNKYSEGYPGKRYYGGQENTDAVEELARERAKKLFRGEHTNVQPLSGSIMNQAVYFGLLEPGDTILAMELSHGGHLTHGAPVSHMGKLFKFVRYKTEKDGSLDYELIYAMAKQHKPKLVLCGYSSYPRDLDYREFKRAADAVGALTMADISHYGGLVAGNAMANPLDAGFDVITTTTHKSLRGPRGGLIICQKQYAKNIDASVFPGLQGGPHMNQVAALAFTLNRAAQTEFQDYCQDVLYNAKVLARQLLSRNVELVCNGTENHLMVINTIKSFGIDGRKAQEILDSVGITANKQVVPDDSLPPYRPSGLRLGTPAATSRGMLEQDMIRIADWIVDAMTNRKDPSYLHGLSEEVASYCMGYPTPGIPRTQSSRSIDRDCP